MKGHVLFHGDLFLMWAMWPLGLMFNFSIRSTLVRRLCPSVKFSHFDFLSRITWPIQPNSAENIHGVRRFLRRYGCYIVHLRDSKWILAHLSWKLKWAFLITCRPASVCPSVYLSVCKLFTFSFSSPEPLGQFQPNLAQSILGWRGFKFVQMKGPALFQGR